VTWIFCCFAGVNLVVGFFELIMVIGVDGGALSIRDERLQVGVYKITKRFLEYLPAIKHDFRVYTFQPVGETDRYLFKNNIHERVLRPSIGWHTIRLPLELMVHKPDIFLGLSQMVPSSWTHNIGFIYDLGFFQNPEHYPGSFRKLQKHTDYLVKNSSSIITISESVKNDIRKRYQIDSEIISVCYPGIDPLFFQKSTRNSSTLPYFLAVGAMKPGKNIPSILEAFSMFLKETDKKFKLILVGGDYWPDKKIDDTIVKYRLQAWVQKVGYISDTQLQTYYRQASAYIALGEHEGFSLPTAEAMASGVPVIVANSGALPETSRGCGAIVDPNNIPDVARAMNWVLRPEVSRKMSTSARKYAALYTWEGFTEGILNVIHSNEPRI
jgi:glycosyltransferase involved in cell wall biosynthesis